MSNQKQQKKWVREEVVILVVEYFRTRNCSPDEIKFCHEKISSFLRKREQILSGETPTPPFRDFAGIRMQSNRIRCLDPDNEYCGMVGTALQKKIVSEYLKNPEELRKEAEAIYKKYNEY